MVFDNSIRCYNNNRGIFTSEVSEYVQITVRIAH